jgi:hypothetical protein
MMANYKSRNMLWMWGNTSSFVAKQGIIYRLMSTERNILTSRASVRFSRGALLLEMRKGVSRMGRWAESQSPYLSSSSVSVCWRVSLYSHPRSWYWRLERSGDGRVPQGRSLPPPPPPLLTQFWVVVASINHLLFSPLPTVRTGCSPENEMNFNILSYLKTVNKRFPGCL